MDPIQFILKVKKSSFQKKSRSSIRRLLDNICLQPFSTLGITSVDLLVIERFIAIH